MNDHVTIIPLDSEGKPDLEAIDAILAEMDAKERLNKAQMPVFKIEAPNLKWEKLLDIHTDLNLANTVYEPVKPRFKKRKSKSR